ncbi:MAG: glycosyltransferase family 2 protein [Gemmatimonadota bacterium]
MAERAAREEAGGNGHLRLSVVIPVRDERRNVGPLAEEISACLEGTPWEWECLWIDDGSRDGTPEELGRVHAGDPRHAFVLLAGRYGQSVALAEGFRRAQGDLIATLDGDGQNDPAELPILVRHLLETGADMVNGRRVERQDSLTRRISSRIANAFRNRVTGERVRDVGCSLRVFRRECVERLPVFGGMHRFLPSLVRLRGFERILELPVRHRPRRHGEPKYGIRDRLWVGIADTLAVRWMQARMQLRRPELLKTSTGPAPRGRREDP